ncbi:MAG: glucosaminidase domain-containing protein [Bacteroidales bacterium]|nr:glucosaminidase domain-containing protein [Bacteroidales bacterium]
MKLTSLTGLISKSLAFLIFPLLVNTACNRTPKQPVQNTHKSIKVLKKQGESPEDIIAITDSLVPPIVYSQAIPLDTLPVNVRKQKFFDMMLPAVLVAKTKQEMAREKAKRIIQKQKKTPKEKSFIDSLEIRYNTQNPKTLIKRLQTLPVSVVLAQSAIESGWGTSRFFREANNPFGMWSFNDDHARIVALYTRDGKEIYLRKFKTLESAIEAYYYMLATRKPYQKLRNMQLQTDDPFELIKGLSKYSERGDDYVDELALMIRANDLTRYDSYVIAPQYILKAKTD